MVAAGSPASGQRLYAAASRLAEICGAQLDALFVEDSALLQMASLPFARVVNADSARIESLDIETLARQIRAEADQLRALFFQTVSNQPWSGQFSVLHGNVCQQLLSQVSRRDVLVCATNDSRLQSLSHLGQTLCGLLNAGRCSLWIEGGVSRAGGSIVSVVDRTPIPWHVIQQAVFWSQRRRAPFVCLVMAACPGAADVVQAITDFIAAAEIQSGEVVLAPSASDVIDLLERYSADLLVLDAYRFRDAPEQLQHWLMYSMVSVLLATES